MYKILFILLSVFTLAQNTSPISAELFSDRDNNLKGGCYRIPSLITAQDGTLIAVADQRFNNCGDLKYNDEINIVMRRSFDNGFTWTPIEKIVDFPDGESASDASMVLNKKTGDIILFYNYMDLKNARDVYKQHYIISKDNGKTWSNFQDITNQIAPKDSQNDFKFITSGRAAQSEDGIIYQTLVNLKKGVFIFKTEDNGNTWQLIDTPVQAADETNITVLNNGNILLNSRVKDLGFRKLYELSPNGIVKNERIEKTLKDPACNASMIDYKIGKQNILLFSNANSEKQRKNLTIKYSLNNGKSWSYGKVINPNFSAYSSLTQMKDNNVGVLYEAEKYSSILFSILPLGFRFIKNLA